MVVDVIFVFILAFLFLYSYITTRNQFAATASAIRQIWAGGCRLSCRQSEYSGFSGLSSLQSGPTPGQSMASRDNQAGHSRECSCDSCPCALIENFLRTCRPASNMYSQCLQCTFNCVNYFIQMIADTYQYFTRVLECNTSCQQQTQLVDERNCCGSNENYSFSKEDKEKIAEKLKQIAERENSASKQSKEITEEKVTAKVNDKIINLNKFDDRANQPTNKEKVNKLQKTEEQERKNVSDNERLRASSSRGRVCKIHSDNIIPTEDESKLKENSEESAAQKGFCSKCVEKGRTCVKECPRAKQNIPK